MPAPRPAPGRHNGGGSGGARKRGQKYQNTFAFKHNNSSKKTEHILSLPVGGVCQRCYDQLMWRKAFRKFKPRTVFGRCNHCAKKNVKNAYCTICRDCATKAKCCAKCGRAKATVPFQKTDEELRADEQRLAYEMQFMKERERRKIQREQAKANDKYLQRQLRRLAEGKSTDAGFGGTNRVSASGAGAAADALGAADIDWKSLEQPTDLASQVSVLQTYYASVDPSKTAEEVAAIVDKRRGEHPALPAADWALLCAKLQLKYPSSEHPLALVAAKIDEELNLSDDDDDDDDFDLDGDLIGSEYADSLMEAMGDLGWETETDADSQCESDFGSEIGDDDGEDNEGEGAATASQEDAGATDVQLEPEAVSPVDEGSDASAATEPSAADESPDTSSSMAELASAAEASSAAREVRLQDLSQSVDGGVSGAAS